ncbi:MAG: hypothetical protein ACTSSR_06010 [Alphaproteobacteria bacterium]
MVLNSTIPVILDTERDDAAAQFAVATGWTDLDAYKDFLVERMLTPIQ